MWAIGHPEGDGSTNPPPLTHTGSKTWRREPSALEMQRWNESSSTPTTANAFNGSLKPKDKRSTNGDDTAYLTRDQIALGVIASEAFLPTSVRISLDEVLSFLRGPVQLTELGSSACSWVQWAGHSLGHGVLSARMYSSWGVPVGVV